MREHVELAYAQTGHGAQGRTVDYSLLLVDREIDNRGVYVPMTRGKIENHAYVALDIDDPRTARDVLADAVTRDWADIPAITELWRRGSVVRSWLLDLVAHAGGEFADGRPRHPTLGRHVGIELPVPLPVFQDRPSPLASVFQVADAQYDSDHRVCEMPP